MIVIAPHPPANQVKQHGTKTCHIHRWDVGNFLQKEINPKLHRETEEGRRENTPLVSPVKLFRTTEVETLIKTAVASESKYHIGS